MNAEFFEALAMLEAERGLSAEYLLEKIKNAIVIAVKKITTWKMTTLRWRSTPRRASST